MVSYLSFIVGKAAFYVILFNNDLYSKEKTTKFPEKLIWQSSFSVTFQVFMLQSY